MKEQRQTIRLPNPGCHLIGIDYDKEKDVYTIRYGTTPRMHAQVIVDTGISLPTNDPSKIRYERVKAEGLPLEAISNSPDPFEAARRYVERVTAVFSAGANARVKKILEGLEKRADELEIDELAKQILEDLPNEPQPSEEELAKFDYMKADFIKAITRTRKTRKRSRGKAK